MLDVTTTITVNGRSGDRFLSSLVLYESPLPQVLYALARGDRRTLEVDADDADLVARFVDDLIDSGWIAVEAPPLLFSPRVGDEVVLRCEVLAEVARVSQTVPQIWRALPAETRGKLIGWRDREGDTRAVVDVVGAQRRLVVFVGDQHVTRAARRK
ncbi:MAG: hypothetical protein JWO36_7136 [Myxococcales bacterium]|nr:hypothetical protein [Myxococcales bacterium]